MSNIEWARVFYPDNRQHIQRAASLVKYKTPWILKTFIFTHGLIIIKPLQIVLKFKSFYSLHMILIEALEMHFDRLYIERKDLNTLLNSSFKAKIFNGFSPPFKRENERDKRNGQKGWKKQQQQQKHDINSSVLICLRCVDRARTLCTCCFRYSDVSQASSGWSNTLNHKCITNISQNNHVNNIESEKKNK